MSKASFVASGRPLDGAERPQATPTLVGQLQYKRHGAACLHRELRLSCAHAQLGCVYPNQRKHVAKCTKGLVITLHNLSMVLALGLGRHMPLAPEVALESVV